MNSARPFLFFYFFGFFLTFICDSLNAFQIPQPDQSFIQQSSRHRIVWMDAHFTGLGILCHGKIVSRGFPSVIFILKRVVT